MAPAVLLVGLVTLLAGAAAAASGTLRPALGTGVAVLTSDDGTTVRRYTARTTVAPSSITSGQALHLVAASVDELTTTGAECLPSSTDTTDAQPSWGLTRVTPGTAVDLGGGGFDLAGSGTVHRVREVTCSPTRIVESVTIDIRVPAGNTKLVTPGCYVVFPGENAHLLEGTWSGTLAAVSIGAASCSSAAGPIAGSVVSGSVTILLPGSSTPVPLRAGQPIPAGSVIDATAGAVRLRSGTQKNAVFSKGAFKVGPAAAVTELSLTGGDFSSCKKRALAGVGATSPPRVVRRLWGNGKGRFRTRARFASAAVRGTAWEIEDLCTGTRVRVRRGAVEVRNLRTKKLTVVRAGQSITIPA
jgi:hypothetical protein